MGISWCPQLWRRGSIALFFIVICSLWWRVQSQASSCTVGCGSNSDCLNGICACQTNYTSPSETNADCISLSAPNPQCTQYDIQCTYCGSFSQGPCVRCVDDLFLSGESCVTFCEAGFQISVLPNTQISARVCMTSNTDTGLPEWAVIVIAVVAVIIFVLIVVAVVGFALTILTRSSHGQFDVEDADLRDSTGGTLRTKRSNSFSFERKQEKSKAVTHHNPNYIDEIEGDDETVFYHKLKYLRTQAEVFLKMLNDMRRRLKEIPVDSAAAQQYRNVMQDVTRLLYLLNKKSSAVEMPPDGLQLLVWSEQILERYLSSQGVTLTRSSNRLSILGPQDETQF